MKYIKKYKSPNYNSRKNCKIKFIIIHYTALKNSDDAISFLCNPSKKVSSHYLITQKGQIYLLVDEKFRAWHAGLSKWENLSDINSHSIGIELDYSNYKSNNHFSKKLIIALKKLVNKIKIKYKIDEKYILGHSDIAPYRKIDPGPKFPWLSLINNKLLFKINKVDHKLIYTFLNWLNFYNINTERKRSIFILAYIGYDTSNALKDLKSYNKLINAYRAKYINLKKVTKKNKETSNFLLKHFINLVLTQK